MKKAISISPLDLDSKARYLGRAREREILSLDVVIFQLVRDFLKQKGVLLEGLEGTSETTTCGSIKFGVPVDMLVKVNREIDLCCSADLPVGKPLDIDLDQLEAIQNFVPAAYGLVDNGNSRIT